MQETIGNEGYTFTVGETEVSDIPLDRLCGLKEPEGWKKSALFKDPGPLNSKDLESLPDAYDLREQDKVTGVRNQAFCGSCWAFSAVGVFEALVKMNYGETRDFSEQYLVSCNEEGWGCDGGWFAMHLFEDGAAEESCFEYAAQDLPCKDSCSKSSYKLKEWYFVNENGDFPTVEAIKTAIYNYGPVSVAVYVDDYFQNYTGGVYNRDAKGDINHAVILAGWGEDGYMYIAYGAQQIGYGANYITIENSDSDPEPAPDPAPEPEPTPEPEPEPIIYRLKAISVQPVATA